MQASRSGGRDCARPSARIDSIEALLLSAASHSSDRSPCGQQDAVYTVRKPRAFSMHAKAWWETPSPASWQSYSGLAAAPPDGPRSLLCWKTGHGVAIPHQSDGSSQRNCASRSATGPAQCRLWPATLPRSCHRPARQPPSPFPPRAAPPSGGLGSVFVQEDSQTG